MRRVAWTGVVAVLALGCGNTPAGSPVADGGSPFDGGDGAVQDGGSADASPTQAVQVNFAAMVGTVPFDCATVFHGLGTTHTDWTPGDFRFYVHGVRLVTSSGTEVPVTLDEDPTWQHQNVALLDFENGAGTCMAGTPATNRRVTGRVPVGTYAGLHFNVGVPFDQDHQDVSVATPPLDVGGMFWSWAGGYKFFRTEGQTTGQPTGFNIHLGSAGCTPDATGRVVSPCASPNVIDVQLPAFNPATQTVTVDLALLTAHSNLDANTPGTPPGCMSAAMDPECVPLFAAMGLAYDGTAAPGPQTFIVVR